MTFTLITNEGLLLYREDIFATRDEADKFAYENPLTPSGNPVVVVSTENARIIQAEVARLRRYHENELRDDRLRLVSRVVHNAKVIS